MVGEITAASHEQAQGIEQINKAVTEMDQVVQQNAASAEESASASEEMNAQAEQMKEFVTELIVLVNGSAGNGRNKEQHDQALRPLETRGAIRSSSPGRLVLGPKTRGSGRSNGKKITAYPANKREASSIKLIPFDDDEMQGF